MYVSPENTGTNPAASDTDGDSLPDGMEVNLSTNPNDLKSKVQRPNIIFILADDLGYGDVGCFWQNQRTGIYKFATPALDAMASQGAMLTHHYAAAPICAPSRASFLLGQHQGHNEIRNAQFDKALPNNHNVASILKTAGYRTIHVGKAGLAGTLTNSFESSAILPAHPLKRGFDRYFGYLRHDDGHEHYPRNGTAPYLAVIHDDYTPVTNAYQDLFTGDAWTGFAKKTIIEETLNNPSRPFFLYLSYDTPHFYGQTPPTANYPSGTGLNGGIQWTGAPSYVNTATNDPAKVANSANKHPSVSSAWYPDAQAYVSMIRRLDESVADILQTLQDLGIDQNTLVVFSSDNGPSDIGMYPPYFQSYAGFEGIKTDLWEGGIRVPTIVRWPGTIPATNNPDNIRQITQPSANYDWLATFAEAAKAPKPCSADAISLMPSLTGQGATAARENLYFEFMYGGFTSRYPEFPTHGGDVKYQMQAIRIGDLMGVRHNIQGANDPFRIYNVVTDLKQAVDLAPSLPEIQTRMQQISASGRVRDGNAPRPYDSAPIAPKVMPALTNGVAWQAYEGNWVWLPDFTGLTSVDAGGAAQISAAPLTRTVDAGLCFEGFVSISTAGNYTFQTVSNGPTCLFVHNARVIDNDRNFSSTRSSQTVNLLPGLHPFRVYYRHTQGTPSLALRYSGPGIPMQTIPSTALFTDQPSLLPDKVTTKMGQAIRIDALANDRPAGLLTLDSVAPPFSGSATLDVGQIDYHPEAAFLGVDTFDYTAIGSFPSVGSSITATVLFDDEVWFPLDEASGRSVTPMGAPVEVIGTLSGPTEPTDAWIPGIAGAALRFGGRQDIVYFPSLQLPVGAAPRTFSCWFRAYHIAPWENQCLLNYGGNQIGGRFTIHLAANDPSHPALRSVRLDVGGGRITASSVVSDGLWHHLAVVASDGNDDGVLDVSETKIYLNGALDGIAEVIPQEMDTGSEFFPSLGGSYHAADYNFEGDLDDVRVFARALDAQEIATLCTTLPVRAIRGTTDIDGDGDGFSDLSELVAGTDPVNPTSYLRFSGITRTESAITLTWTEAPNRVYTVEQSIGLQAWSPVSSISLSSTVTSSTRTSSLVIPLEGPETPEFRLHVEMLPEPRIDTVTDTDGDGRTDASERVAGTDPDNTSSFFVVNSMKFEPPIVLQCLGVAGRIYVAEESVDLLEWSEVPGVDPVLVTQPGVVSIDVPHDGSTGKFFRLTARFASP